MVFFIGVYIRFSVKGIVYLIISIVLTQNSSVCFPAFLTKACSYLGSI